MEILASRVILRPADYDRTLAFYRDDLGLAISREYPGGTVLFAGQTLLRRSPRTAAPVSRGSFSGALWLQVRDIAAARDELEMRGVTITREPRQEPWGLHEMWVADPDGVPIVLVEVPATHPLRRDTRS